MDQPTHEKDLSRLMKKIAYKAKEDGVISEDEYNILEKVSFDDRFFPELYPRNNCTCSATSNECHHS